MGWSRSSWLVVRQPTGTAGNEALTESMHSWQIGEIDASAVGDDQALVCVLPCDGLIVSGAEARSTLPERPPQKLGINLVIASDGHIGTVGMSISPPAAYYPAKAGEAIDLEDEHAVGAVQSSLQCHGLIVAINDPRVMPVKEVVDDVFRLLVIPLILP